MALTTCLWTFAGSGMTLDPTLQVVVWSERQLADTAVDIGRSLVVRCPCLGGQATPSPGLYIWTMIFPWFILQCPGYLTRLRPSIMDAHI